MGMYSDVSLELLVTLHFVSIQKGIVYRLLLHSVCIICMSIIVIGTYAVRGTVCIGTPTVQTRESFALAVLSQPTASSASWASTSC